MKKLHLLCNAHIDPMWLWEWEEGVAVALSTFRVAAELCETFEGFIFNHNEALLYSWVEEYDPPLFRKIQELVRQGKWHIMGGWYVQPDCNMPSGESLVRQGLIGKCYFRDRFGVEPTTAINFDPFGHTRGLVQILKKLGHDSYLFCRPDAKQCSLPGDDFVWVGYDGSEIMAHRSEAYNSRLGQARQRVQEWLNEHDGKPIGLMLWGVGNHGGGPSRADLKDLAKLIKSSEKPEIIHSTPETYFGELNLESLPRHKNDINPFSVGCYTSQIRIKQKHRLLENEIYAAEKMLAAASIQGYLEYDPLPLREALEDLLLAQFHDILPGSSIQAVENAGLRLLDHGLEIASRVKSRAFFALMSGQKTAKDGEIPILIYNPHPFPVRHIIDCEYNLPDVILEEQFARAFVFHNGKPVPCQPEREHSNVPLEWRKRIVFTAELAPSQMNRFDCQIEVLTERPKPQLEMQDGRFTFQTEELFVVINAQTGLMDKYAVNGVDYIDKNAFLPIVLEDTDDAWGISVKQFRNVTGAFKLMSQDDATQFCCIQENILQSVRVIEDGDVRTVIEAMFRYHDSSICQIYRLPKQGTEIEIEVCVYWNEKRQMLKWSIPTSFEDGNYLGQVAYGVEELSGNGNEMVAQKWVAAVSEKTGEALTCINDGIYGSDFKNGEIRLSLLRSPGYASHPFFERPEMAQDRFSPRIDQGERIFRFWLNGGKYQERIEHIDREALMHNEKPFALSYFPSGAGAKPGAFITLSDDVIQMTAFKKAENSKDYILRLFEPTGKERTTILSIPSLEITQEITLSKFEIKTLKLDPENRTLTETELMEQ